ncbi:hypothetical protein BDY21DRAFT_403473 [Lineolata rhizophorae]|uniref:Uncharacterized protein n=1 Tax=Lineolata rhizophorae TaxID=578093 RepID=A0A6A6PB25_9PEZI|nr:hypothetical protein BDY21DRAFT_403473 [Lineolata rhizophorae]
MRIPASLPIVSTLLFAATVRANPDPAAPFEAPVMAGAANGDLSPALSPNNETSAEETGTNARRDSAPAALLQRQNDDDDDGGCSAGYGSCASIGAAGWCCSFGSTCTPDFANQVACCAMNVVCTGTIGATNVPNVPSSAVTGGGSSADVTLTLPSSTGGGFVVSGTTATAAGAPAATSTLDNPYYPFPVIATTYSNAAACSSAYSKCQDDAGNCAAALQGDVAGITVVAPNGGVTVQGVSVTVDAPAATSICSSLSAEACSGLQVEACAAFGDGGGDGGAQRLGGVGGLVQQAVIAGAGWLAWVL